MNNIQQVIEKRKPEDASNALAFELVAKLVPAKDVLDKYGITEEEFAVMAKSKEFQLKMQEAKALWNSQTNTLERIRVKTQMQLEDALPELTRIASNPTTSPKDRIEAVKQISKLAGAEIKPVDEGPAAGSTFSITINLGEKESPVTIDATANEVEHEE